MPCPKKAEDYLALANRRNFAWLGPFPKNTKGLTLWECPNGHRFRASYNNVDRGMNCKKCVLENNAAQQRHSTHDYHALAEQRGFIWIGPPVSSAHGKTVWECENGHRWSGRYNDIQQGRGCKLCGIAKCAAIKRRQPAEYHHLAGTRGFIWLGPVVQNTKAKTEWKCCVGHHFKASFNQVQQGQGCPKCSGLSPKRAAHFHELAKRRGFKWLGTVAVNTRTRTAWECPNNHRWPATYGSILGGSGCPACSGNLPKTIADFRNLAETRGFLWLGPVVPNIKTETEWQCPKGHRWPAAYNTIQQGNGCAACSGQKRKTPQDYHVLADKRRFKWLGPEVENTGTKTEWTCGKGHTWQASYHTIQSDHGCPDCLDIVNGKRVSKNQRKLCEMIGGKLNGARVGRYTIDVATEVRGIRIAVEYDSWYCHAFSAEKDALRDQALLTDGWRVLRIRSNGLLPSKERVEDAISQLLAGELWLDIVLKDWGTGSIAPWLLETDQSSKGEKGTRRVG